MRQPKHPGETVGTGRIEAISTRLKRAIAEGLLRPGDRVPSIREAAADQAVSKNTVAEAYDRLVAAGELESRPGSGYFVSATPRPPRSRPPSVDVAEALDLVSLLREQLDHHYAVRPGDGRPPPAWMEGSELASHFSRMRGPGVGGVEYGYGNSWGYPPLRERICLTLAERSIHCTPDQVLLTHGANHALDLVIRALLEPGDTAFIDDPGYYPLFGKLRLAKVRVVGIRRALDGPDLEDLHAKLALYTPKALFTQSLAHNPTGGSLSLRTAHALLLAAERHGFQIVEEDPFGDILPAASPRLAALDQLDRVILVGTFSKTLSASLRVGFVAAQPGIVRMLADLKLVTVVATSDVAERFVFGLIANGHYLRHLRRLRNRVRDATERALGDLAAVGLPIVSGQDKGFYLWAELPRTLDEAAFCREAARSSIFLAPGSVFRLDRGHAPPSIRINVAYASDPRFLAYLRASLPA